jgi:hypothetical protein
MLDFVEEISVASSHPQGCAPLWSTSDASLVGLVALFPSQ